DVHFERWPTLRIGVVKSERAAIILNAEDTVDRLLIPEFTVTVELTDCHQVCRRQEDSLDARSRKERTAGQAIEGKSNLDGVPASDAHDERRCACVPGRSERLECLRPARNRLIVESLLIRE